MRSPDRVKTYSVGTKIHTSVEGCRASTGQISSSSIPATLNHICLIVVGAVCGSIRRGTGQNSAARGSRG